MCFSKMMLITFLGINKQGSLTFVTQQVGISCFYFNHKDDWTFRYPILTRTLLYSMVCHKTIAGVNPTKFNKWYNDFCDNSENQHLIVPEDWIKWKRKQRNRKSLHYRGIQKFLFENVDNFKLNIGASICFVNAYKVAFKEAKMKSGDLDWLIATVKSTHFITHEEE